MPVKPCTSGGKSGFKWGDEGKCYTGPGAKAKAAKQGRAIEAQKHSEGGLVDGWMTGLKELADDSSENEQGST